jgi:hypothetical protein
VAAPDGASWSWTCRETFSWSATPYAREAGASFEVEDEHVEVVIVVESRP